MVQGLVLLGLCSDMAWAAPEGLAPPAAAASSASVGERAERSEIGPFPAEPLRSAEQGLPGGVSTGSRALDLLLTLPQDKVADAPPTTNKGPVVKPAIEAGAPKAPAVQASAPTLIEPVRGAIDLLKELRRDVFGEDEIKERRPGEPGPETATPSHSQAQPIKAADARAPGRVEAIAEPDGPIWSTVRWLREHRDWVAYLAAAVLTAYFLRERSRRRAAGGQHQAQPAAPKRKRHRYRRRSRGAPRSEGKAMDGSGE